VLTDCFDHTSLLKYLIDKWRLGPLYSRAAVAQTSLGAIRRQARDNTPPSIPLIGAAARAAIAAGPARPNRQQTARVALSHLLETMAG
jgi:hypothetical protein